MKFDIILESKYNKIQKICLDQLIYGLKHGYYLIIEHTINYDYYNGAEQIIKVRQINKEFNFLKAWENKNESAIVKYFHNNHVNAYRFDVECDFTRELMIFTRNECDLLPLWEKQLITDTFNFPSNYNDYIMKINDKTLILNVLKLKEVMND